jgi:hypothetical protein
MKKNEEMFFEIPSNKVDTESIMKEIRQRIKQKEQAGIYHRYNRAKIHTLELQDIENEEDFLGYYLKAIGSTWAIDINDWEIINKGGVSGKPIVLLKKIIWKLLKFYTYRLWSQQREFNAQIANTVSALNKKFDKEIQELKSEVKRQKSEVREKKE